MSVGANIRRRRYELGLSQQELADAMGYKTRSTIAKIESEENDVTEKKLRRFAQVLDTTVEALIRGYDLPETIGADSREGERRTVAVILAGGKSGRNQQNIPNQGGQSAGIHQNTVNIFMLLLHFCITLQQCCIALNRIDGRLEFV